MKKDRPLNGIEVGILRHLEVEPKGLFVGRFGDALRNLIKNNLVEHLGVHGYQVTKDGRAKLAELNSAAGV